MLLALIFVPVGVVVGLFLVMLIVADVRHDRRARKQAVVRRETVPIRPWPHDGRPEFARSAAGPVRSEHGAAEGRLLRKLTMVCVVVLVVSGLVVFWIDQARPETRLHAPDGQTRPAHSRPEPVVGGGRCAR